VSTTDDYDDYSCPKCGGECVRDEVDIGVGVQHGHWVCIECGYTQGDDLRAEFPELFKEDK